MLTIRLMRFGRKHQSFFRLVVVPKRGKPDRAKYIEQLGWVNPVKHEQKVDAERVKHWIGVGAQPSPTAWNLFVREGIVEGPKRPKVPPVKAAASVVEPSPAPAAAQEEKAPADGPPPATPERSDGGQGATPVTLEGGEPTAERTAEAQSEGVPEKDNSLEGTDEIPAESPAGG